MDTGKPVLVLGPPRYVGPLGVMRSLGSLGVAVYAARHRTASAPNASRYCRGTFAIGDDGRPTSEPERDLEQLLSAGRRLGAGTVLFAGSDEWSFFVAEHAAILAEWFRFPKVSLPVVEQLASKDGLYELALTHGIPTPRIAFPANAADAARLAADLSYPVFIKPVISRPRGQWKEVVHDAKSLLASYRLMEESPESPNLMFQEYIPGTDRDVWMIDAYYDAEGQCLAGFTGQKLRQHPATMGIASFGECRHNNAIIALTQRLIDRTGYRGLVDIGYRYDARDDQYKIIDFNPRLGGAFRLFVDRNGLDVARAFYLDLTGQPVPPAMPVEGRRWVKEDADLIAFKHYRRLNGLGLREWLRSWRTADEGALFSRRDPAPLLVALYRLGYETITRRARHRVRRGSQAVATLVRQLIPRAA